MSHYLVAESLNDVGEMIIIKKNHESYDSLLEDFKPGDDRFRAANCCLQAHQSQRASRAADKGDFHLLKP